MVVLHFGVVQLPDTRCPIHSFNPTVLFACQWKNISKVHCEHIIGFCSSFPILYPTACVYRTQFQYFSCFVSFFFVHRLFHSAMTSPSTLMTSSLISYRINGDWQMVCVADCCCWQHAPETCQQLPAERLTGSGKHKKETGCYSCDCNLSRALHNAVARKCPRFSFCAAWLFCGIS